MGCDCTGLAGYRKLSSCHYVNQHHTRTDRSGSLPFGLLRSMYCQPKAARSRPKCTSFIWIMNIFSSKSCQTWQSPSGQGHYDRRVCRHCAQPGRRCRNWTCRRCCDWPAIELVRTTITEWVSVSVTGLVSVTSVAQPGGGWISGGFGIASSVSREALLAGSLVMPAGNLFKNRH